MRRVLVLLLSAGVAGAMAQQTCEYGEENVERACVASCSVDWTQRSCRGECTAKSTGAFAIVSHYVSPGSRRTAEADIRRLEVEAPVNYEEPVRQAFDQALARASAAGRADAASKLTEERASAVQEAKALSAPNQMIRLRVRGTYLNLKGDGSPVWVEAELKVTTKCIAPPDLVQQLLRRHGVE